MVLRALLVLSLFLCSSVAFAQYRHPSSSAVSLSVVDREAGRESEVYRYRGVSGSRVSPGIDTPCAFATTHMVGC